MDRTVDIIMIRNSFNDCVIKIQGIMYALFSEHKITTETHGYITQCLKELSYKMTCLENEFYKERQENQKQAGEQ